LISLIWRKIAGCRIRNGLATHPEISIGTGFGLKQTDVLKARNIYCGPFFVARLSPT
jgi:hypothetical protein